MIKMKEKNGFTLIELLAVIVVLGIVMVIGATTVLPLMEKAKKQAFVTEVNAFVKAADNAVDLITVGSYDMSYVKKYDSTGNDKTYCFSLQDLYDSGVYTKKGIDEYGGIVYVEIVDNNPSYQVQMYNKEYYVRTTGHVTEDNIGNVQFEGNDALTEDNQVILNSCGDEKPVIFEETLGGQIMAALGENSEDLGLSSELKGDMYRFYGWELWYNYICFGSYSDDVDGCLEDEIYRILGITKDGKVKVIKNTSLFYGSRYPYEYGIYSAMFNALNATGEGEVLLQNGNDTGQGINGEWYDMIVDYTWKDVAYDDEEFNNIIKDKDIALENNGADEFYELEKISTVTKKAKIGLMSLSDFYYAAYTGEGDAYSWIAGVDEWLLNSFSDMTGVMAVDNSSYQPKIINVDNSTITKAVRPVFYIRADLKLEGSGTPDSLFYIVKES